MKRLLLFGLLAVTAQAVDVSGTYENFGTVVGAASSDTSASFHGLLGLEFDLSLARALFSKTDRVVIKQADTRFAIRCLDANGEQTWGGRWDLDVGYGVEKEQVKLVFSKHEEKDGFLFLLSAAGDGKLLLVEVHKIQTTWFGPVGKPLGTFIFSRVPEKRRAVTE